MTARGRAAVLGAGTMGHGIAQVLAMAGYDVALVDTTLELAERGIERVRANLEEGVRRGKLTAEQRDGTLTRLLAADDVGDAVRDAALVIEAIPERMDAKIAILQVVEEAARADALLATNTSSLSVTRMQRSLRAPGRMLGLHFFNPVHLNPLVEVVRGEQTTQDTMAAGLELVRALGKEPVVVRDSPGFATSRLGVLLGLEAIRMVEEGVASVADIDRAMELGYRHPMGPLRLTDIVGLDVRLDIARYLHAELGLEQFRPPALLERMVAEGRLGRKTGGGFYDWTA